MEWLVIFGLAIWVYRLQSRTSALEHQVNMADARATAAAAQAARTHTPEPTPQAPESPAPTREVSASEPSTPAPEPERFVAAREPAPEGEPFPPIAEPLPPIAEPARTFAEAVAEPTRDAAPTPQPAQTPRNESWRAPPPPPKPPRERNIERWLSENGLAWLGGGALALGGIFLVAYAAQRGMFTPMMRLGAAVLVGALLIGASEWVRRAARGLNHPLVAALLAGAGAATLYGAVWGAHGIYEYIDWSVAALAMAAIVVLLLGLALLHGEAIGVLAIIAGLLAPLLTHQDAWPESALSLYIIGVTLAGYALAALRRWAWLAGATMIGAYVWYAVSSADGETLRSIALLVVAAIGACAIALTPAPRTGYTPPRWTSTQQFLPSLGVIVSSILVLGLWQSGVYAQTPSIMAPAMAAISFVLIAAIGVRAGVTPIFVLAAAIGALVLGFLIEWQPNFGSTATNFHAWAVTAAATAALAGFAACLRDKTDMRAIGHGAGAVGAFFLLLLSVTDQSPWSNPSVWTIFATSGVLMYMAAEIAARTGPKSAHDAAVSIWALVGSALILFAVEFASDTTFKPLAFAIAALALTLLHRWRGWHALPSAAIVAATASLVRAILPDFSGQALTGAMPMWLALSVLLGSAAALLAASRALRRGNLVSEAADSLSTGAIILAVLSAFLVTHRLATGDGVTPLSDFTRFSLYSLVLTVAGYSVIPRGAGPVGIISRARGHVLLLVGLLFSVTQLVLALNPWWGVSPATISGPPIVNETALAFAAPGLLALLTAGRYYTRDRGIARAYAIVGAVFVAICLVLEIRYGFHGIAMSSAPIGLLEGNAYGLSAMALGLLESWVARVRERRQGASVGPLTHDLQAASSSISIVALMIGIWMMAACYNPFWGLVETEAPNVFAAIASIGAHLVAALMAYGFARLHGPHSATRNFAVFAAFIFVLIAGFLTIRFAHHGTAMDAREMLIGTEGLWLALWPMALATFSAWTLTRLFVSAVSGSIAHAARQFVDVSIWLALGFIVFGLCVLFPPWWGLYPAQADTTSAALVGLGVYLLGAWLAAISTRFPIAKELALYVQFGTLASVLQLFVASTLTVRRIFRGADMAPAFRDASLETWTYSAVWALFSAIVLWTGTATRNAMLRWTGLALFLVTTAKVFLIDMARLDGVIRAASFLGLGGVLVLVALAVRANGQRNKNTEPEA